MLHPQAGQTAGLRDRHIKRGGGAGTGQADAVGHWVFGTAGACRQHKGIGDTPLCQAAGKPGGGGTGSSHTGHDFDWNTGVTRGIHFLGSVVGWERWLVETSGFFLLWRLCLYGATVCGWVWMRRRLLARESGMEARRRLLRAEVAGVVGIVALEASLLMQAT